MSFRNLGQNNHYFYSVCGTAVSLGQNNHYFYNVSGTAVSLGQKNVSFIGCSELRTKQPLLLLSFQSLGQRILADDQTESRVQLHWFFRKL